LALINARPSSILMARKHWHHGIKATAFGLIALMLGACASTASAPVVYGRSPGPVATIPGPIPPPPPVVPPRPREPIFSPVPASTSFDLPNPVWDEASVPRAFFDRPYSECVPFARKVSGVEIYGDAITWWTQAEGRYPKSFVPVEGSVLVLRGYNGSNRGHVAAVKSVLSERIIRVDHANWLNGGEVSFDVPVIDVSAANDWSEVRVWHIPGGHWGGRVYVSDGFIHPITNPDPAVS
jgi:hypothetical protein